MDRLTISPTTQALIDDFRATHEGFEPGGLIYEGTNLVDDDHLQIDNDWTCVALGGESSAVWACMPAWEDLILLIALVDYVSDRAGPNGEAMPIYDEQAMTARTAEETVAAGSEHEKRDRRRSGLRDALRAAIKRLPHDQQKHAREVLRKHGALGKDDG